MEQGLLLTGAEKCLFMASNGDRETMRYAWYESSQKCAPSCWPAGSSLPRIWPTINYVEVAGRPWPNDVGEFPCCSMAKAK